LTAELRKDELGGISPTVNSPSEIAVSAGNPVIVAVNTLTKAGTRLKPLLSLLLRRK
jgi:hypothetical protein